MRAVTSIRRVNVVGCMRAVASIRRGRPFTWGGPSSGRAGVGSRSYILHVLQVDVQSKHNAIRFVLLKRGGGVLLSELLADHRLDTVEAAPPELQNYTTEQARKRKTVLDDKAGGRSRPHQCRGGVEETVAVVV